MKNSKKVLKKKFKTSINKAWDYWCEMEYNIFRVMQFAKLGLFLTSGAVYYVLISRILSPEKWSIFWKLMTAYFIPPAGKETVIPLLLHYEIHDSIAITSIFANDVMSMGMIITNWWLLEVVIKHSKIVKKYYEKLQSKSLSIRKKKMGILLPIFLSLFMIIPFQGSGAITTAIVGSILGFSRRDIVIIVMSGSIISIMAVITIYKKLSLM